MCSGGWATAFSSSMLGRSFEGSWVTGTHPALSTTLLMNLPAVRPAPAPCVARREPASAVGCSRVRAVAVGGATDEGVGHPGQAPATDADHLAGVGVPAGRPGRELAVHA